MYSKIKVIYFRYIVCKQLNPKNMKQPILSILLLVIFSTACYAQETKKIKHTVKYEGDIQPIYKHKEVYYVLRDDKSVKQGPYLLKSNKKPLIEGWYHNGLKDSLWTYNFFHNNKIRAKGYYKNGKKVGVWEYYNGRDAILSRFDYTNDTLLFTTCKIKDTVLPVKTASGYKLTRVDSQPIFKEFGSNYWYFGLVRDFIGDQSPVNKRIYSTIQFEIDSLGVMSNFKVKQGNYDFYNEYTLKRVKQLPNEWVPAKINGKPVSVLWSITLSDKYLGEFD